MHSKVSGSVFGDSKIVKHRFPVDRVHDVADDVIVKAKPDALCIEVSFLKSLSDEAPATPRFFKQDDSVDWKPYVGPRGGQGWRNSDGDVVYDDPPGDVHPGAKELFESDPERIRDAMMEVFENEDIIDAMIEGYGVEDATDLREMITQMSEASEIYEALAPQGEADEWRELTDFEGADGYLDVTRMPEVVQARFEHPETGEIVEGDIEGKRTVSYEGQNFEISFSGPIKPENIESFGIDIPDYDQYDIDNPDYQLEYDQRAFDQADLDWQKISHPDEVRDLQSEDLSYVQYVNDDGDLVEGELSFVSYDGSLKVKGKDTTLKAAPDEVIAIAEYPDVAMSESEAESLIVRSYEPYEEYMEELTPRVESLDEGDEVLVTTGAGEIVVRVDEANVDDHPPNIETEHSRDQIEQGEIVASMESPTLENPENRDEIEDIIDVYLGDSVSLHGHEAGGRSADIFKDLFQDDADPYILADVLSEKYSTMSVDSMLKYSWTELEVNSESLQANEGRASEFRKRLKSWSEEQDDEVLAEEVSRNLRKATDRWSSSSSAESTLPMWAVADELYEGHNIPENIEADLDKVGEEEKEAMKDFFESERERLREMFGDSVRIFRGVSGNTGRSVSREIREKGEVEHDHRTIASWSLNPQVTDSFASGGVIFEQEVSIEQVLTSFYNDAGLSREVEIVASGGENEEYEASEDLTEAGEKAVYDKSSIENEELAGRTLELFKEMSQL